MGLSDRFPESQIIGIDITDEHIIEPVRQRKNIDIEIADIYQQHSVEQFRQKHSQLVDIIIDDALHDPGSQYLAFQLWRLVLAPGGIYVIEDVYDPGQLSYLLSRQNENWDIFLGDTRIYSNGASGDSILFGMVRIG